MTAEYRAALSAYLADAAPAGLQPACDCGRAALAQNLGVLELGAIHHEALQQVLAARAAPFNPAELALRASEFFLESLSPFERSDRALRQSNEQYRALIAKTFTASPIGIIVSRLSDGQVIEVNDSYLRMVDYRREQLIGHTPTELNIVSPEARASMAQALRAQGSVHGLAVSMRARTGSQVEVLSSLELMDLDGEPAILAVHYEVTAFRRAEDALRKSEERFARAFQSSPAGMTITRGADRIMIEANDSCSRILGYSRAELVGRTTLELGLVAVADRTRLAELLAAQGFVRDLELDIRTKAGESRRVQYSAEMIELEGKACVLATIHDVSELRRTEAVLERQSAQLAVANQELEAFSYSVSHDLRAPLRSIDGFARLLERDSGAALSETGKRHLQVVRNNAQRMGQLIDDLLSFSRLNRQTLRRETVQLTPFVQQLFDELKSEQNGRHIELHLAELGACQADPALLKQVWLNLLSNALKYTRKRAIARIAIDCRTADGEQVYSIRDNGAGFDMAYADKLFGVFQRLHRMEDFEGTGVGLAIVQRIVTRHGGRIWAEAALEQGATFFFTLGAAPSESVS